MKLYLFSSHYHICHFTMSNCLFAMNNNFSVLNTVQLALADLINKLSTTNARIAKLIFHILNTNNLFCTITLNISVFIRTGSGKDRTVIYCRNAVLKLNGPLTFKNFKSKTESILVLRSQMLQCMDIPKFSITMQFPYYYRKKSTACNSTKIFY